MARAVLSNPETVARAIRGEKGGAEIEVACLIRHDYCGLPRPARFPKFESREVRRQQNNPSDRRFFPYQHLKLSNEIALDKTKNGSRQLNKQLKSS